MKMQKGFTVVETVLIFIVVSLVGFIGWYVYHAKNTTNSIFDNTSATSPAAKTTAEQITQKVESVKAAPSPVAIENTSAANASSGAATQTGGDTSDTKFTTYTSKYEGISFKYPSTWSFKDWDGNSKTSDGVTVESPNQDIVVSFASPAAPATSPCTDNLGTQPLVIQDVQKLDNGTVRQSYLIRFTATVNEGPYKGYDYKGMGVTDWDGKAPTIGKTDKCNYTALFSSKKEGSAWFNINTSYAYLKLSYNDFFNLQNIKAAEDILKSATYN